MSKSKVILIILSLFLFVSSCKQKDDYVQISKKNGFEMNSVNWDHAQRYYLESIDNSINSLERLEKIGFEDKESKKTFAAVRANFKKAEPYASYLNPAVGNRVNGPPLPVFNEENLNTLPPVGLQKLEEDIYLGGVSKKEFLYDIKTTKGLLKNLKENIIKRELTSERFFIATHHQLLRIISLSISGFDTPLSHLGFDETIISLESLWDVYGKSIRFLIRNNNPQLDKDFEKSIKRAIEFVQEDKDFESFDRFTFIRDYLNPITAHWASIRKESHLWKGSNNTPFNFDAPTFFEEDSFNIQFFMPSVNRNYTKKQIALGEELFFEKNLSKNNKMACATCHIPEKAYSDGLRTNNDNMGLPLDRNTPTLLNSIFQQGFFWDGRSRTLADQISSVFVNSKEFNTVVHQFSTDILADSKYKEMFKEAFGGISPRNTDVIKALTSYVATLNGFNSKFDRNMRAEENTYTKTEKLGFNLFMGKALCATCHFIPLTNGTVPPFYLESEREVIGIPESALNLQLDGDYGIFWQYNSDLQKGMFKTPTLRNTEFTGPYMHNGVYETLEEVIDFYDIGGGLGLGFNIPHQTLPQETLDLSIDEKEALISFIHTLTDTNVPQKIDD